MDMMKLLRSLEEFLYELVGWLVFYPRTLWRIIRHPGAIARYTRLELVQEADQQFQETISPVLMLILSVALAHGLELVTNVPMPSFPSALGQYLLGTEQGLLLTRSTVFAIYSLGAALGTLRHEQQAITRATLRAPFSIQAFLVCPFILGLSVAQLLLRHEGNAWHAAGLGLTVVSCAWYIAARVAAYRALHPARWLPSLVSVLLSFGVTTAVVILLVALVAR